jgi:hypothetical protein
MMTDCVAADTYAGVRCGADAALGAGTVILNVALVDAAADAETFDVAGVAVVNADWPPPHALMAVSASRASVRFALFTESELPTS